MPLKPLKVIFWLVQDSRPQLMKSVCGSPVQHAFHPAVRSLMRKYAESVPEVVCAVPKQLPVIPTVWVAVDLNGPTALILGVQGPVAAVVGPLAARCRCIAARTEGEAAITATAAPQTASRLPR